MQYEYIVLKAIQLESIVYRIVMLNVGVVMALAIPTSHEYYKGEQVKNSGNASIYKCIFIRLKKHFASTTNHHHYHHPSSSSSFVMNLLNICFVGFSIECYNATHACSHILYFDFHSLWIIFGKCRRRRKTSTKLKKKMQTFEKRHRKMLLCYYIIKKLVYVVYFFFF